MRIAVIADHVHPVAAPFAGGLEAMTWYLSRDLARRGHEVTLFARDASEVPGVRVEGLTRSAEISDIARHDVSMPSVAFLGAHHAYLDAINRLTRDPRGYDVVQIHSLHHLPVALARLFAAPVVLTLHSPPTPWLESALSVAGEDAPRLVTVSRANSALWAETVDRVAVIPNGVDLQRWRPGSGAMNRAIWSGRMVAEKAPHLAVAAARRAGMALVLAGPIEDPEYFERRVAPHLDRQITYAGLVGHQELSAMIGESRVCLQTPQWDEPFCLAAAEAIACGTPVASFDRGGLAEVVGRHAGVLAEPGDVDDLARAATLAAGLPRAGVRAHAEATLSLARCVSRYEALYDELICDRAGNDAVGDAPTLLVG